MPLSTLLIVLHRLRTEFHAQLQAVDYHLLVHQLALQQSDARHLHSNCALLLSLYDEYLRREAWPTLPAGVVRDALAMASSAGEGAVCERLLRDLEAGGVHPTIDDLNLVLWGKRADDSALWEWWTRMEGFVTAAPAPSSSPPFAGGLQLNADSLLILLHANADGSRWVRVDCWLLRRTEDGLLSRAVFAGPSPSLSLLFEQLFAFVEFVSSPKRAFSQAERISALAAVDATFNSDARRFQWWPLAAVPSRLASLYRTASTLRCPLSAQSLRLLLAKLGPHTREDDECDPAQSQPRPTEPYGVTSAALFSAGLRRELELRWQESAEPSDSRTPKAPWQGVLAAYDRKVSQRQHVDMADSLAAIQACHRGKHWQRAVELLIIPRFPQFDVADLVTVDAGSRAAAQAGEDKPLALDLTDGVAPSAVDAHEEYIDLSPVTGRWSGPQTHRVVFCELLQSESWADAERLPRTRLLLPKQSAVTAERLPLRAVSAAAVTQSSPPAVQPWLGSTVLHYAHCIAAMDDAGNAESVRKADLLHAIALVQFPFLLHLYNPVNRVLHLVHPSLPSPYAPINAFVHDGGRTHDRLWSLLYLPWRLLRRLALSGERSEAADIYNLEEWYAAGQSAAVDEKRQRHARTSEPLPLRVRIEAPSEVGALRRVLRDGPWSLKVERDAEWPLRSDPARELVTAIKGARKLGLNPLQPDLRSMKPASAPMQWEAGWRALCQQVAMRNVPVPCIHVPYQVWHDSLHRAE